MSRFFALKRGSLISLALAALLALAPAIAEARMGGGGSFGSRGSRSWSAPPSTRTMPGQASPFERSVTPRPSPGMAGPMSQPGGAFGGAFGRGMLGGLAGGLLGAGLFGLLTGHGLFGGMGGFMSIIGLLLQIALIVFLARMAFNWWTRRNANAMAGAGHRPSPGFTSPFTARAPFGAAGFGSGASPEAAMATPIKIARGGLQRLRTPARRNAGAPIAARILARCAACRRRKWPPISTTNWRRTAARASSTASRT